MVQLKARLDGTRTRSRRRSARRSTPPRPDYRAALKQRAALSKGSSTTQRGDVTKMNNERDLLSDPRDRDREHADPPRAPWSRSRTRPSSRASSSGLRTSNIKIVDRGPRATRPVPPERPPEPHRRLPPRPLRGLGSHLRRRLSRQQRQGPRGRREARRPAVARHHPLPFGRRARKKADVYGSYRYRTDAEQGPAGEDLPVAPGDRAHQPSLPQDLHRRGLPDRPDVDPVLPRRQHAPKRSFSRAPCPRRASRPRSPTWPSRSPSSRAGSFSSTPICASRGCTRSSRSGTPPV